MHRIRGTVGAAGVEAALVLTFLIPLLGGMLAYGNYFWQAQKVDVYAPHIDQSAIVGTFTCGELLDRVKATVVGLLVEVGGSTSGGVGATDVVARVVEVLPTGGVTVRITVSVPVNTPFASLLPNGGDIVSEVTTRLENVSLTTASCS